MNKMPRNDPQSKSEASIDQDGFECVVCGSSSPEPNGWILPTEDTEVVNISLDGGIERELGESPRPICSMSCKNEFQEECE